MMKRSAAILIVFLASHLPLGAQERTIASIDCDFVQEKHSELLSQGAVSSGHMTYSGPGRLEWSYTDPLLLSIKMEGGAVTVEKDGIPLELKGNELRLVREIANLVIGCIEGPAPSTANGPLVELLPRTKDERRMWTKIVITHDTAGGEVRRFEMHEANGDTTLISFKNVKYVYER